MDPHFLPVYYVGEVSRATLSHSIDNRYEILETRDPLGVSPLGIFIESRVISTKIILIRGKSIQPYYLFFSSLILVGDRQVVWSVIRCKPTYLLAACASDRNMSSDRLKSIILYYIQYWVFPNHASAVKRLVNMLQNCSGFKSPL